MFGETSGATIRQSETNYQFSEVFTLLILLPVIACYPLYYLTRNEDQQEALDDEFDLSPVSLAPRIESAADLLPAVGYAAGFFAVLAGVLYLATGSVLGVVPTVIFGAVGLGLTMYLGLRSGMKRELAQRFGIAVIFAMGIPSFIITALVVFSDLSLSTLLADPALVVEFASTPFVSVLLGATSGNAFIVKRNELRQLHKQHGEDDPEGESHVVTDSHRGETVSDREGQALLERLAEQKWTAPDDLVSAGQIRQTRKIEPFRDIVRGLWVEEDRYEHTIAKSEFREKKREFRADPHNRSEVAPSGFSSETYKYIFEDTITERRCRQCNGHGAITCDDCGGQGEVQCRDCGGSGRQRCPRCNGDMRIVKRERCSVCGGDGTNQRGYTCGNCGGDGGHETRARCPNCNGQGEVACGSCRSGMVRCGACDGSGELGCGNCGTTGKIVEFDSLTRTYTPSEDVSYRNKSVPTDFLTDADGTRVDRDRDENPSRDGLYRREEETRKIPVTVATYEYLGDKWEVFDVEDALKVADFPRDYAKQMKIIQGAAALLLPLYLFLAFVGV